MWRHDSRQKPFNTNGTEGMLDVILSCTLIFILLTCLIQAGKSQAQEQVLPAVSLTKAVNAKAGSGRIRKHTITMKKESNTLRLFYNEKMVSLRQLEAMLKSGRGVAHIALRRDKDIPCEWEDRIIMLCRGAGVSRVSIVVGTARSKKIKGAVQ